MRPLSPDASIKREKPSVKPDARLGIRYDAMSRPVRSYVDNLKAQVKQLMAKSGSTNIEELEVNANAGKVPIEDIRKIRDLMNTLVKVVRTGEIPHMVILAESKDGTELRFDLREIREQWDAFYRSHNLANVADLLPPIIHLTPEQVDLLKTKAKEGYTRPILIPANIEKHLQALKENLTDGLENDSNGTPIETWVSGNVKPSFPNQIQTTNPERVGKAYLLLTNPDEPLLPGSKDRSADELLAEFNTEGLSGLTLADFLIEERSHFEQTNTHLVDRNKDGWTWLLSSRDSAFRVLHASWDPSDHRVEVPSNTTDSRFPSLGARPSVVFSLSA